MTYAPKRGHRGAFSLIELSLVIVIYGSIAAMGIVLGGEWIAKQRLEASHDKLDVVAMALESYAKLNGRLPCPAKIDLAASNADYGLEAWENGETLSATVCTSDPASGTIEATEAGSSAVAYGAVPANTLGISESMMADEWGSHIVYYVTTSAVEKAVFEEYPKQSSAFLEATDASAGAIEIVDGDGVTRISNAMFVLLSPGANRHGGYTTKGARTISTSPSDDDKENCDCNDGGSDTGADNVLVDRMLDNTFDDLLLYRKREHFLLN